MPQTWTYNGGTVFTDLPDGVDLATQAELDAHSADTTAIHGIPDTSVLVVEADLGSAAAADTADFDPAGAADQVKSDLLGGAPAAALDTLKELSDALSGDPNTIATLTTAIAAKQAASATLTAVAAKSPTTFGLNVLEWANAAAGIAALGLGTAATHPATDFDSSGAAAAVAADLVTEENTRAGADSALGVRATALEAKFPLSAADVQDGIFTADKAASWPACSATNNPGSQTVPSGGSFVSAIDLTAENWDTDGLFDPTGFALTGTVAKTSGSAAVVGTGTQFTTQLYVGDRITIPGTANETFYVSAITDNTHLTLSANAANTASGQVATRGPSHAVITKAGIYVVSVANSYSANATGRRLAYAYVNGAGVIPDLTTIQPTVATGACVVRMSGLYKFAVGDVVQARAFQDSGSSLSVASTLSLAWHNKG